MFLRRLKKSFREIDYGHAAKINLERRFLDRRPIHLEMKSGVGVRAVVHAHRDRAEIYARAFCDLVRNTITKWFVAGPFSEIIRSRAGESSISNRTAFARASGFASCWINSGMTSLPASKLGMPRKSTFTTRRAATYVGQATL